jgi:hypothetical protein
MIRMVNRLLIEIATPNSIYDEIINNIISPRYDLKPELISEIAISFLENKEKIDEVYRQGYFKYYFINTVKNQVHSNTSSFHKNVRVKDYEFMDEITLMDDDSDINDKIIFEEKLDTLNKIYKGIKKDWFQATIWDEYFVNNKTYRQIETDWGIDHCLAFHTVKKMKKKIKIELDKLNKNY